MVEEMFQHLIDPGYLSVEQVTLNTDKDEGFIHIRYKDRIRGESKEIDIP